MRRREGDSGFTLVELLVALVVTGLVMAGSYGLLQVSTEAWRRTDEAAALSRATRGIIQLLREAVRSIDRASAPIGRTQPVGEDEPRRDSLELLTASYPFPGDEPPAGDLWQVAFYVAPEGAGEEGPDAVETTWNEASGEPMLWFQAEGSSAQVLSEYVHGLGLRYLDAGEWVEEWPEGMSHLPQAVEITLWVGPPGRSPDEWIPVRTQVALP